jgi:CheY-like chemotaxis protein
MDIRMPHINGVELCHALRKIYEPDVKFIALTAHVFPQERQALIEEGFDIVLTKPFHERQLINLLGITPPVYTQPALHETKTITGPPLDLTTLRQMTLGDENLFISVLNQFQDETAADLETLEEQIKLMEAGPIREIVHKLAGRVGQIGITQLSAELRQMEDKLVQGAALQTIMPQLVDIKDELQKLLETIRTMTVEQSVRG